MKRLIGLLLALWAVTAQAQTPGMINTVAGTTYTFQTTDCDQSGRKLIVFTNAAGVAATLPQAGVSGTFSLGCSIHFLNNGAGTVTVTPVVSTINGTSSLAIGPTGGAVIYTSASGATNTGNYLATVLGGTGISPGSDLSTGSVTPTGSTVRTLANALAGPLTLTGSGTSGQYDAQIGVTGGGSLPGQGTLTIGMSPFQNFLFTDGSIQFSVGWQAEAAEYWDAMGGKTGAGGYLYATNGLYNSDGTASGNVNGSLVAQGLGTICAGDGAGILGCFAPSAGPTGSYITIVPSNLSVAAGGSTAAVISNGDVALVPNGVGNRITAVVPDGTTVGGVARAAGCRDWQGPSDRTTQFQVCNGDHGVILGGQSNTITAAGSRGTAMGFGNSTDGVDCNLWGNQAACDTRRDVEARAGAPFAQPGDAQIIRGSLMGSSVAGAAIRLTSTGTTAGAQNCWNLPLGKAFGGRLTLIGQDSTTAAHQVLWTNRILVVHNNGGSMTVTNGTADAVISPASDTITVSSTADATNSCLNFTVTPTTQTGDTWWYTLELDGAEARH